jgi:hypothetical protein
LRHVSVSLGLQDLSRHVPDEDGSFGTGSHDELLVR